MARTIHTYEQLHYFRAPSYRIPGKGLAERAVFLYSVRMKCRIIRMLRAEVDVPKYELRKQAYWSGDLTIMDIRDEGLNRQMRVAKHSYRYLDNMRTEVLYEPHIIWMNEDRFTLASFERVLEGEKIVHYAQSWLCCLDEAAQ